MFGLAANGRLQAVRIPGGPVIGHYHHVTEAFGLRVTGVIVQAVGHGYLATGHNYLLLIKKSGSFKNCRFFFCYSYSPKKMLLSENSVGKQLTKGHKTEIARLSTLAITQTSIIIKYSLDH
jgi:hypothetical protein